MSESKKGPSIKTTGQLREFMVQMMLGLKNGDVDYQDANALQKMASQINESFYAEIKIAKMQHEFGDKPAAMGELPINKADAQP